MKTMKEIYEMTEKSIGQKTERYTIASIKLQHEFNCIVSKIHFSHRDPDNANQNCYSVYVKGTDEDVELLHNAVIKELYK